MGNLNSIIQHILLESKDPDVSGKYSLFVLYSDNEAVLHLFEDRRTYEAMKYKFTSDDKIKRLGASRLPENTTFKKLSESIQHKFNVPRERFSVRTHGVEQDSELPRQMVEDVSKKSFKPKNSIINDVLQGKEKFTKPTHYIPTEIVEDKKEPTINSFRPATTQKIDLSKLNTGDRPMLG